MIDIDKYEEAQKETWRDAWGEPYFELHDMQRFISDNGPNSCNDSDVELWADAPLLLAEVKRLREGIKKQIQFTLECVGSDIGDLYETIAEDLRRLIE